MAINVNILSDRKGSNPGGKCRVLTPKGAFDAYFKYCNRGQMHGSSLEVGHQPIYEAITFQLTRMLGMKTTDFYVLKNGIKDVSFSGWGEAGFSDPSGRKFYFLSKWLSEGAVEKRDPESPNTSSSNLEERDDSSEISQQGTMSTLLRKHQPYLESLLISDVLNKRQNYAFSECTVSPEIVYLDLGCNFVRAVNGEVRLRKGLPRSERTNLRNMLRRLKKKHLIDARDESLIDLEKLVEQFPEINLPVLNGSFRNAPISEFLSSDEIEEIQNYLIVGLYNALPKFNERGLLINE